VNYLEEMAKREALKEAEVATAEQWILKATELDPAYAFPLGNLAKLYGVLAAHRLLWGQDPSAAPSRPLTMPSGRWPKIRSSRGRSTTWRPAT
jgi:hypothetical protein